jgi:hypothetical protein
MAELFKVEISGADAVERGRQYGEAARPQIARSLEFYAEVFERSTGLLWKTLTERTESWVGPIRDYSPDGLDEVRGIAEGAGRSFHELLALNGRGELTVGMQLPNATANGKAEASNGTTADGCTSFAMLPEANAARLVWAGQNWDWRDEIADTVVMLRVEQPGKPTIIASVEPNNPLENIFYAVRRRRLGDDPEQGWHVEEGLTVDEAIRAYTINPARASREEAIKGSVTEGKLADLVVLSENIRAIEVEEIPAVEVLYTVFDGQIVYSKNA